jgi:hypothetical protein
LLVCSGCGKPRGEIVASHEREVPICRASST